MANEAVVTILDATGTSQSIAMVPATWAGVSAFIQATIVVPWTPTSITTAGVIPIKGSPGTIGAIINLDNTQPQAGNIQIFNNTAGNGQLIANVTNLADSVSWPPGGIECSIGITAVVTGTPSNAGYQILWF